MSIEEAAKILPWRSQRTPQSTHTPSCRTPTPRAAALQTTCLSPNPSTRRIFATRPTHRWPLARLKVSREIPDTRALNLKSFPQLARPAAASIRTWGSRTLPGYERAAPGPAPKIRTTSSFPPTSNPPDTRSSSSASTRLASPRSLVRGRRRIRRVRREHPRTRTLAAGFDACRCIVGLPMTL